MILPGLEVVIFLINSVGGTVGVALSGSLFRMSFSQLLTFKKTQTFSEQQTKKMFQN